MSLPDTMLRGKICEILERNDETQSAAEKLNEIEELIRSEQRLFDFLNAPGKLGVCARQMYRWIKSGKLTVVKIGGIRFVDVSVKCQSRRDDSR